MITSFTRNDERAAAVAGFSGISHTGIYTGFIAQAEIAEGKSGAQYLEIAFKCKQWKEKDANGNVSEGTGDRVAFIRTYITSKTGERTFGADIIDAMMVCLGVSKMDAVKGVVYGRNASRDKSDQHQGYRLPDIEKKPIGLLIQREDRLYTDNTGVVRESFNLNILTPFDPANGKCAREILEKADKATVVESRFATLKDKPVRSNAPVNDAAAYGAPAHQPAQTTGSAGMPPAPEPEDFF